MALTEEMRLAIKLVATDSTKQAFGQLNGSLNGLKQTALQVAAVVGSALAFRDIIDTTKRVSDEINMLRDNFGMTAEQASRLDFTLKAVGSSAEEFTMAEAFLNKKIIETLPHIGEASDDFAKWGISILNSQGHLKGTGEMLGELREKMQAAGPGQAAMGMAFDLLGKSNRNLTEFLQLTDEEIVQLHKDAEEMGQVFTEAGVKDMKQFTRQINILGIGFDGIKVQIGQFLIPVLRNLLRWFRENAGAIKAFGEALRAPLGLLKQIAERIGKFFGDIRSEGLAAALIDLGKDIVEQANKVLPQIGEELDKLGPLGWAIKFVILSAAVGLAAGAFASLFGDILGLLKGAAIFAKWVIAGDILGASVGLGLTLLLITAAPALAEAFDFPVLRDLDLLLAPLAAAQGFSLAIALGANPPVAIAVGAGILIGIVAAHFENQIKDLFSQVGDWFDEHLAPLGMAFQGISHGKTVTPLPARAKIDITGIDFQALFDIGGAFKDWVVSNVRGLFTNPPPFSQPIGVQPPAGPPPPPRPSEHVGGTTSPFLGDLGGVPITRETLDLISQFGTAGQPLHLFQHGGVVRRPTLGMIGEAGPEAVIPLGRSGWGGMGDITININGNVDSPATARELAERVASQIVRRMRGFGQPGGSPTSAGGYF